MSFDDAVPPMREAPFRPPPAFARNTTSQLGGSDARLQQVIVLCRHGARLPEHCMPQATFYPRNESWWQLFGGQLSPVGVEQMRRVGEELREHYASRLEPVHAENVFKATDIGSISAAVDVISSKYVRTVFTAQSVLLGAFPDVPTAYVDDRDEAAAVPDPNHGISIRILGRDNAFMMGAPQVQAYTQQKREIFAHGRFAEWSEDPQYRALLDKVWDVTAHPYFDPSQDPVRRLQSLHVLEQHLEIDRVMGIPAEANFRGLCFSDAELAMISNVAGYIHRLKFQGHDAETQVSVGKDAAGLIVHEVYSYMRACVEDIEAAEAPAHSYIADGWAAEMSSPRTAARPRKQFVLLSAHDQTIMAVLSRLRIRNWAYPELGSYVIFELWRRSSTGAFTVRVRYNSRPSQIRLALLRSFAPPPLDAEEADFAATTGGPGAEADEDEPVVATRARGPSVADFVDLDEPEMPLDRLRQLGRLPAYDLAVERLSALLECVRARQPEYAAALIASCWRCYRARSTHRRVIALLAELDEVASAPEAAGVPIREMVASSLLLGTPPVSPTAMRSFSVAVDGGPASRRSSAELAKMLEGAGLTSPASLGGRRASLAGTPGRAPLLRSGSEGGGGESPARPASLPRSPLARAALLRSVSSAASLSSEDGGSSASLGGSSSSLGGSLPEEGSGEGGE